MLLYITAEDAFGEAAPARREPRPLHTIPSTVSALYDMGMRHHIRPAALLWPAAGELAAVPDWKLDRTVIRVALFGRERLGLGPGTHAAIFGRLDWLWPVAEFTSLGLGATSVGIEHDVPDDALVTVFADADPKVIFATDPASAARLMDLRAAGLLPRATVVSEHTGDEAPGLLPLQKLMELAGTLDTAERAQDFRTASRGVEPGTSALWHVNARGVVRLTHAESMGRIAGRLRLRRPVAGSVAYLQPPRMTLANRLALAACVGDGLTMTALGREHAMGDDVLQLRPHTLRVTAAWLDEICAGCGPRWPVSLDRRAACRRVHERLGDRVRVVETERMVSQATAAALAAADAHVIVDEDQAS